MSTMCAHINLRPKAIAVWNHFNESKLHRFQNTLFTLDSSSSSREMLISVDWNVIGEQSAMAAAYLHNFIHDKSETTLKSDKIHDKSLQIKVYRLTNIFVVCTCHGNVKPCILI